MPKATRLVQALSLSALGAARRLGGAAGRRAGAAGGSQRGCGRATRLRIACALLGSVA
jgi:hypothetical protein